jgi:K+-transporting ATPase KdpF subunit
MEIITSYLSWATTLTENDHVRHHLFGIGNTALRARDRVSAFLFASAKGGTGEMNIETTAAILCSVFLLAYLIYAMLRPEKF